MAIKDKEEQKTQHKSQQRKHHQKIRLISSAPENLEEPAPHVTIL